MEKVQRKTLHCTNKMSNTVMYRSLENLHVIKSCVEITVNWFFNAMKKTVYQKVYHSKYNLSPMCFVFNWRLSLKK